MKYVLVLFVLAGDSVSLIPDVIEVPFDSNLACWNAGFSLKTEDPSRIRSFNCVRLDELEVEPDNGQWAPVFIEPLPEPPAK
jgi:hypothetical protein